MEGGASKRRRPQPGRHESREQLQFQGPEPRGSSLLISLARQVIRQEEELKVLRQDHALIYFMKPGEHTMLSHLYRTAQQFLKKQNENPHWAPGQHPLKAIMAVAVFNELGARLERACKEEDFLLESQGARMAGSCGGVEVPVLGQCGKTPGGGQIEKAAHRSGGVRPLAEACKASADPGPGSSLRMQAETVGDNGRDGHVPHGPVHSDTPKLGGMAFSTGSAGLHGVTAGRHRIPQGEFQAQPGNRQNQRDDPLAMMLTSRLILTNRSQNICYMNSVVQVCHWLLQLRPTRVALMGTGKVFFDALQKHHFHNPKNLLKDAHWRAVIVGWRDHRRQHDAAEFFSYLCQTHNFSLFQGQWDARRIYQGLLQVRDTGLCTQPVVLSLPRTPPGSHSWITGREHNLPSTPFRLRPWCSLCRSKDFATMMGLSASTGTRLTWTGTS